MDDADDDGCRVRVCELPAGASSDPSMLVVVAQALGLRPENVGYIQHIGDAVRIHPERGD